MNGWLDTEIIETEIMDAGGNSPESDAEKSIDGGVAAEGGRGDLVEQQTHGVAWSESGHHEWPGHGFGNGAGASA